MRVHIRREVHKRGRSNTVLTKPERIALITQVGDDTEGVDADPLNRSLSTARAFHVGFLPEWVRGDDLRRSGTDNDLDTLLTGRAYLPSHIDDVGADVIREGTTPLEPRLVNQSQDLVSRNREYPVGRLRRVRCDVGDGCRASILDRKSDRP